MIHVSHRELRSYRDCVPRLTFGFLTSMESTLQIGYWDYICFYLTTNSGYTTHLGDESVNVWYSFYAQYSFYIAVYAIAITGSRSGI